MKKLRLLAVRSQQEELLRELMILGCVQISDPEPLLEDPELGAMLHRGSSETYGRRSDQAELEGAVKLLDSYAPVKQKLLSAKPEVSEAVLLSEETLAAALEKAREIDELDDRIHRITVEVSRQKTLTESLRPWVGLDVPLDTQGTKTCALVLGMLPAVLELGEVSAALAEQVPEAQLFAVSTGPEQHYVSLICLRSALPQANEVLRAYNFSLFSQAGMEGTVRENILAAQKRIKELEEEKEALTGRVAAFSPDREELKLCADRMGLMVARAEAADRLVGTEDVVVLEGWASAPECGKLEQALTRFDCAWELSDPEPDEYPEVPVKLRNGKVADGLNMVTNMYSLPQYGTVDPNPLMAPFFIPFYGIMMADMGYGLLMILASVVATKKMRPKEGTLSFCRLLLWCGISTFVMGVLTGGFFADAPYQIVHIFNPASTWQGLPALFSPLNDSIYVLIGAMVLGILQLNAGLVVSFVQKLKNGDVLGGLLYECALWVILVGILLFAGSAVLGLTALKTPGLVVLIVGAVALFAGGMRGKKGLGCVTSIFGTLYNELTGWFGDILSYSRIMALMLAGSVIGQVFNTIGAMFHNIFLFIPIFLIGHVLNFGLNLLGCYVHDLRLQCLEYFGKFYSDGGRAFVPLKIRTKFVDVKEVNQ